MPADSKTQEKEAFLDRCCPSYRAAVTGRKELPGIKTKCGAVQFRVLGFSDRVEHGHTIIRATIDEGQVVELKLPAGYSVVFPTTAKQGRPAKTVGGAK